MAYTYKTVRDLIPNEFSDAFIKNFESESQREYDHDNNYNGDSWLLAAEYIRYLLACNQDFNLTIEDYFINNVEKNYESLGSSLCRL